MFRIAQVIFAVVLALGLSSCAKSDVEKAQDHAQEMTIEHETIRQQLIAAGDPSSSWTDQQINDYEAKMNRLESLEQQLHGVNGTNGIIITGGYSRLGPIRSSIASIRAEKSRIASSQASVDKVKKLSTQMFENFAKVDKAGEPTSDWTEAQLNAQLKDVQALQSTAKEILAIMNQHVDLFNSSIRTSVQGIVDSTTSSSDLINRLLNEKLKAATQPPPLNQDDQTSTIRPVLPKPSIPKPVNPTKSLNQERGA